MNASMNLSSSNSITDIVLNNNQYKLPIYFTLDYQHTLVKKSGIINQIKKTSITLDIDLNVFLYDSMGQLLEMVWYKNLRDTSQNIRHHGDELLGKKTQQLSNHTDLPNHIVQQDELESIEMRLQNLPNHIHYLALTVNTFSHSPLNSVNQGNIRLQDSMGQTLQHIDLTTLSHKADTLWIATLYRQGFEWRLKLHNAQTDNKPLSELMTQLPKKYDTKDLAKLLGQRLF